jgi:hypothetical protein
MQETFRAEQWLYGLLSSDAGAGGVNTLVGGRIYAYLAPLGAPFPLVVFSHQGGHDVRGVGPMRVMASMVYQVKVIGEGTAVNFGAVKVIADRIDALLQGASGVVVDGQVLSCVREQGISYVENRGADVYSHLGGLYRLQAQAL